jgi:hypothetical protein
MWLLYQMINYRTFINYHILGLDNTNLSRRQLPIIFTDRDYQLTTPKQTTASTTTVIVLQLSIVFDCILANDHNKARIRKGFL